MEGLSLRGLESKGPGGEIPKFGAQLGDLTSLLVDDMEGITRGNVYLPCNLLFEIFDFC